MNNPLTEFYVQPGTFVRLPSKGKYYDSQPKLTADGEIEIRPMNAIDELQFQNPDGLLNNDSLMKVIARTVPGIQDVEEIIKPDLDILLIGLRIATYGEDIEVESTCKECKNSEVYNVNLTNILANAKEVSNDNEVMVGDLKVKVRPFTISSQHKLNEYMLDIQRTARLIQTQGKQTDDAILEQLRTKMNDTVQRSAIELFNVAGESIISVTTPDDQEIIDPQFILEWLQQIKAPEYQIIRNKISELSGEVINRTFKYKCNNCETENESEVNFDPANFFAAN